MTTSQTLWSTYRRPTPIGAVPTGLDITAASRRPSSTAAGVVSPFPRRGQAAGRSSQGVDRELTAFCQYMFDSLPRSDQRRCAEAYLYGLVYGTGRRSSRGIATSADRSDQALQQFVNQSPWRSTPVRRRLAIAAAELIEPAAQSETAWTLNEVAFTKNGRHSIAVERQFIPTLGRTVNAQLAVSLQVAGAGLSAPVNWRLCLPPSWQSDKARRTRARVPDEERHQPYWQDLVALLDEATGELGMPARPIVTDFAGRQELPAFLEALHQRKLDYLVRVSPQQPVQNLLPRAMTAAARTCQLADLTASTIRTSRETVTWRQRFGTLRSQFLTVPILLASATGAPLPRLGQLQVLVEWPFNSLTPAGFWVTNLVAEPVAALARLVKHASSGAEAMSEMADRYGLFDFEGRSFPGWHHHVTLVSAAYLYGLGTQLPDWTTDGYWHGGTLPDAQTIPGARISK